LAILKVSNVAIKGVAASVPKQRIENADYPYLSEKEKKFISSSIGIHSRRIAKEGVTASDLCYEAAVRLLDNLHWNTDEISILIFISQTPDYVTPCTAAVLQNRLGLPKSCLAFDINLGCSAYPYGLSVIASLLQNMPGAKGLLLVGDKSSQLVSYEDKSAALLFSDAGSATALAHEVGDQPMWFNLNTDGGGAESLIVKGGAGRHPFHNKSLEKVEQSEGIIRHELNLILKGLDIFKFSVTQVPPSIKKVVKEAQKELAEVDYFVLHQANKLINRTIGKRLKIDPEKMPDTLAQLGNSSSASIPITIVEQLGNTLSQGKHLLALSGFGVGLSWGVALIEVENLPVIPLIEID
jgi:3-oxoacyl-[acyl-carrier-protein] synthase-3